MAKKQTVVELEPHVRNSQALAGEFDWLHNVIKKRFQVYFQQEQSNGESNVQAPDLTDQPSVYGDFVRHYNMNLEERLVFLLALAPHVCPQVLDVFFTRNEKYGRGFTEFGGVKGLNHSGFLPTGETAAFVISGNNLATRFKLIEIFDDDHFFNKHRIVKIERASTTEPLFSGSLHVGQDVLSLVTTGKAYKPKFSMSFPAQRLTTKLNWEDLVVDEALMEEIDEIKSWITHNKTIMEDWKLEKRIKPGFRTLFYGPPGTGKTLTASLIGKDVEMDVYRVDLSKVVSKYIGETEKNLANIFDSAEYKNWILFFDEADAIFGKRTSTSDAKDRYANQEIAFLLQRIEEFPGIIILATNLKKNIDEAFARRFQSMIYFPMPRPDQRLVLWENSFKGLELEEKIDLNHISKEFEMAGGAIINVLRYCALKAVERNEPLVKFNDLVIGIRKEFRKEGKTV